jgi:hypothetical protein
MRQKQQWVLENMLHYTEMMETSQRPQPNAINNVQPQDYSLTQNGQQ